ncbi:MAG: transposase, partial [Microcystis sp. LE19-84.1B]|uniref:RNA-guided endonuclease InsQ/TnpB family protein n=1 Tax=Microcystis sp. LE19-84.1B TaxID=3016438 RepID=UPI0022C6854A
YRKGKKQSRNYHKARKRYARKHLRVSRQREEFVKSVALRLVKSNDLIAYEDLNIKGMVKNRHLAKSITDAGWSVFRQWLEYFGDKYGKLTIAVSPHNTSQNCSNCGQKVQKSLSTRTHVCPHCGYTDCRDRNAALNILQKGLSSVGRTHPPCPPDIGGVGGGEIPSWLVGEILLANGDSMNEESPSF